MPLFLETVGGYVRGHLLASLRPGLLVFPANWRSRAEIIDYCVRVVDNRLEQKEHNLQQVINDGTPATPSTLFKPHSTEVEPWRGPTSDFYRPVRQISTTNPQVNEDGELDAQERYEFERRQRERENDARAALWEERVKVSAGMIDGKPLTDTHRGIKSRMKRQ